MQTIDRLSLIDRITAEYKDELYEIKKSYDTSKKILDDKYKLAIKQINAIYDAYEVTLWQLTEYKTELLKSKIVEFPDLENSRLNTTLCKINSIKNTESAEFSINLNFDIFAVEYSILEYCANQSNITREIIESFSGAPVRLTFKLNSVIGRPILNNFKCDYDFYYLIIKEIDIIILWDFCRYKGESYRPFVNIIKISTGKLIYNNVCQEYNCSPIQGDITFMYCNRHIIYHYKSIDDVHYFSSYTIDELSEHSKITINHICNVRVNRRSGCPINQMYCDIRGLYIWCNGCIYFIGNSDIDIDLQDLDKITQKFNIKKLSYNLFYHKITDIDYSTCKIYINATNYDVNLNGHDDRYTITLGVSDACILLY